MKRKRGSQGWKQKWEQEQALATSASSENEKPSSLTHLFLNQWAWGGVSAPLVQQSSVTDGLMTIRNGCIWQVPCQDAQGLAGFGGGDLHRQSLEKHKFVLQDWAGTAAMEKEACIIFPHVLFSAIFEASSTPSNTSGRGCIEPQELLEKHAIKFCHGD